MSYMDGPPLATPADLAALLQRDVNSAHAEVALRIASGLVRSYTGQRITFTAGATYILDGGGRTVRLPQRPVVVSDDHPMTVVELEEYGTAELTLREHLVYTRRGDELRRRSGWFSPRVQVTYSHGYTNVPDDIVAVVLDVASRSLTNPAGLRSVAIDDYTRTYATETLGAGALTDANKAALASYRRGATSLRLS
ncbi:hypothetical protein [Streptosporangium sandarakinum]